jgi:cell division protein FtsI/penicillin-binding protein 2
MLKKIKSIPQQILLVALFSSIALINSGFWFWNTELQDPATEKPSQSKVENSDETAPSAHIAKKPGFIDIPQSKKNEIILRRLDVSKVLGEEISKNHFNKETKLIWEGRAQNVNIEYTLNPILQNEANNLLNSYKPDYGAIIAMDPSTGKILAMSSFERSPSLKTNLTTIATFPAASVFKMVTATAALDKYNLSPDMLIPFNGGNYTLYRKNVLSDKITRWTKEITLRNAFARSINTVFGKLSLQYMAPQDLSDYANKYLFNKDLYTDFPVQKSSIEVPTEKGFELAEVASGYNKFNTLSPVQGAMMAASVVENGIMRAPYIVNSIKTKSGSSLYSADPLVLSMTMKPETAPVMRELMEETIFKGTSRKNFKKLLKDKKFRVLEMGGKTGSMTGTNPRGKTDWFVGYAYLDNQKLAIAAITVNKEKWRVKSTYLAQSLVKVYFKPYLSQLSPSELKNLETQDN